MRPIDYEVSEVVQTASGELSLFDLCEPDMTSDPLMQLLAREAEDAGVDIEVYIFN